MARPFCGERFFAFSQTIFHLAWIDGTRSPCLYAKTPRIFIFRGVDWVWEACFEFFPLLRIFLFATYLMLVTCLGLQFDNFV